MEGEFIACCWVGIDTKLSFPLLLFFFVEKILSYYSADHAGIIGKAYGCY